MQTNKQTNKQTRLKSITNTSTHFPHSPDSQTPPFFFPSSPVLCRESPRSAAPVHSGIPCTYYVAWRRAPPLPDYWVGHCLFSHRQVSSGHFRTFLPAESPSGHCSGSYCPGTSCRRGSRRSRGHCPVRSGCCWVYSPPLGRRRLPLCRGKSCALCFSASPWNIK